MTGHRAAHRRVTAVVGGILLLMALTLLTIGANSPYTHANLNPGYDDRYVRTEQIVIGGTEVFAGRRGTVAGGDPVARGGALFVTSGCAGCHALGAQGGAVAKAIAGADRQLLQSKVRQGTTGMPRFSEVALTEAELADIAAFLRSLPPLK